MIPSQSGRWGGGISFLLFSPKGCGGKTEIEDSGLVAIQSVGWCLKEEGPTYRDDALGKGGWTGSQESSIRVTPFFFFFFYKLVCLHFECHVA